MESEQFSFFRIPRALIKDEKFKDLSTDAKLLYGLMLDRMSLSMKNGWVDEENKVYINYSISEVMEDLGYSKPTCIKIMKELDTESGIGLIERKRVGLGKPDIIYVKNFVSVLGEPTGRTSNTDPTTENPYPERSDDGTSGGKKSKLSEVKNLDFQRERNFTSRGRESLLQEVKELYPSYTNNNYTENSYTKGSISNPINLSNPTGDLCSEETADRVDRVDRTDTATYTVDRDLVEPFKSSSPHGRTAPSDETAAYMSLIRKNIEYDTLTQSRDDAEVVDELYRLMCDVVCVKRKTVRVGGENYPYELVKSQFLKLNALHIQYVLNCLRKNTSKVGNIRAYLTTVLYNSANTMNCYYQQEFQHNMYGGYERCG
jgi:hypothetical protein